MQCLSTHYISPDPIGLACGLFLYAYAPDLVNWADPLGLTCKSAFSGKRGGNKAVHDIERNGYNIVGEKVTMVVNGKRIRADFVAVDSRGDFHIFEAKHGAGGLTKNQKGSGVFDMNSPSNTTGGIGGGTITPSAGTKGKFEVATGNKGKTRDIGGRGTSHDGIFHVLKY